MSEASLKIQYSEKQLRLRLRFLASLCLKTEEPPSVLFQKVRSQFEAEKSKGKLDFYEVTEKSFTTLWHNIRNRLANSEDPALENMELVFTAGCGTKVIPNLSLSTRENGDGTSRIEIDVSPGFNWNETGFDMLRLNAYRLARKQGIKINFNQSHLFSLWQELKKIGQISNYVLGPEPGNTQTPEGFYFMVNKQRKELAVVITDTHFFEKVQNVARVHQAIKIKIQKLNNESGVNYQYLSDAVTDRLKASLRGPERWGMHFPLVYLAAIHSEVKFDEERNELNKIVDSIPHESTLNAERRKILDSIENETSSVAAASLGAPQRSTDATKLEENDSDSPTIDFKSPYPGKGKFNVLISDDKMEAQIGIFDDSWYQGDQFKVDIDWVRKELLNKKITHGFEGENASNIKRAIDKKENLTELIVAKGLHPVNAGNAELVKSFGIGKKDEVSESEDIDLRSRQQSQIVTAGQMIAEINYRQTGQDGYDIFGKVLPFEYEPFEVEVGEGVEEGKGENKGKFYAMFNGLPLLDGKKLSLSKVFSINGSVNFNSGNIIFDGNVEIKGNIETGSTIEATGDLIVHGSIEGGNIYVGKNMEAKGGIVTNGEGKIRVRGDMDANFIENSRIIVDGNLKVQKVVLNSDVLVGKKISVNPDTGTIGGGRIFCGDHLLTGNLGFESGKISDIRVGVDWRNIQALDLAESRFKKFSEKRETLKGDLRELVRSKASLKAKEREEKMNAVQEVILRLKDIVARCETKLASAKLGVRPNKDARIYVHQIVHTNCSIEVAGVKVPITQKIGGVEITPKKYRDSNIIPLSGSTPTNNKSTEGEGTPPAKAS